MAMRRDIADLRTTFSVAGVNDVVAGARAAASGLDAVGSAAERQARATAGAAAAGAGAAAAAQSQARAMAEAAASQAAAARTAADAQARVRAAAEQAAAATRRQYEETARAAAEAAKAESSIADTRAADRTADLRRELADIDARMAARKAASEAARKALSDAQAAEGSNSGAQKALNDEISRIAVEKRSANVSKKIRETYPDATAEQRADAEDALHDELSQRSAAAKQKISDLQAQARKGYGVPKLQTRATEAENAEADGNAEDAAQREFAEQRIARVKARLAAELAAERAGIEERLAAERQAMDEAQRLLDRETAATETAAAAQARAVKDAAAAEVTARKKAAEARAALDAEAAARIKAMPTAERGAEAARIEEMQAERRRLFAASRNYADPAASAQARDRLREIAREIQEGQLNSVGRGGTRLTSGENGAAGRASSEERVKAIRDEEAAKIVAIKARHKAAVAEARRAFDETQRIQGQQAEAARTLSRALAAASREAADAQVAAARQAAEAEAAVAKGTERNTEAAVRAAQARYEAVKRESEGRIRFEQNRLDGEADDRRDSSALKEGAEDRALRGAKAQASALQKRLAAWEKANKARKETPDKEAERADFEDQIDAWRETASDLGRSKKQNAVSRRRAEEDAKRRAAEEMRLIREVEDAKVATAARALDEVRRLLAQETLAAQDAAKAKAKAAEDAVKAQVQAEKEAARERARTAAESARAFKRDAAEVQKLTAAAKKAYERLQSKRSMGDDVQAGVANPDKLRADAQKAAEAYAKKAADLAAKAEASAAKVEAASGTKDAAKVAAFEKRSLASSKGKVDKAEAEATHLANVLAEVEKRLKAARAEADRAAAAVERIGAAAGKVQAEFKAAAQFKIDLGVAMRNPRQAEALAKGWAAAYERAVARVVAAAASAQAAIAAASGSPDDVARVKATEGAKVEAAQKASDRIRAQARRSGEVWREVSRRQIQAAQDAARAQERAARRSGDAWRSAADRIGRVQRSLPSMFGTRNGLMERLRYRGAVPMLGGLVGSAGRAVGGVVGGISGIAGSALSGVAGVAGGVFSVLTGLVGMAGKAAGSVLSIGTAAVTAAGRLALYLGQTALAALGKLSSAAVATAGKLAGLARTIVIRTAVVGTGAAIAGYAAAKKAVTDTAETARDVFEGSMATRTGGRTFQMMSAAAKRAGVDMRDFQASMVAAKDSIQNIGDNPTLVAAFTRLNVWTRDGYGRIIDTTTVLSTLMSRISRLNPADQWNVLDQVFGGRENVERMLPLLAQLRQNSATLQQAWARQQALGSIIQAGDIARMRAMNAATADFKDALTGLKLAVARMVGPDIIAGMYRWSNIIAANRGTVAMVARQAFDLAYALKEVVLTGAKANGIFDTATPTGSFAEMILTGAYHTRAFGMSVIWLGQEMRRAFVGVWAQQQTPGQVFIQARRPIIAFAEGVYLAQSAIRSTVPFFKELWATVRGDDARVVQFPWLLTLRGGLETVGRFAREIWRTIRGEDGAVVEFPWLLRIRAGLEGAGRFAGEAWAAITGRPWAITEFPVLRRIRDGVIGALTFARDFAREAWQAITGASQTEAPRFPFLYASAEAVRGFVAEVKATAADLVAVWNGFDPQTWLGEKLQAILQLTDQAKKAWSDLKLVFDDTPDAQQKFNFPWIASVTADIKTFADRVKQAWDTFKGFYDFFDRSIQRMSFGQLDLMTVAIVSGFLTLFGVTRVVLGGLKALALAGAGLRTLFGRTATAAAGGAGGAGLAGALTRTGDAAERSGAAADRGATLWGRLGASIGGVVRNLAANPGIWALLGIGGGIAGDMLARNADPAAGTGKGWAVAGGALQGAGTGLLLGAMTGNPLIAAGGAIAGGMYGAFSSNADYNAKRLAAVKAQLQAAGHADVAAKITETEIPAGSAPEGLSADERSAFGDADRTVGRAEEELKQALSPMGQDIAAIRQSIQRRASRSPEASRSAEVPVADYSAMGPALAPALAPAIAPAMTQAVTAAATTASTAAAERLARDARYRDMQQGLRSSMAGIMAFDPMRAPPVPAPVAAPAPEAAPGRQSAIGGESAMFIIQTRDGTQRQVRAQLADAIAIKDELSRTVPGASWNSVG